MQVAVVGATGVVGESLLSILAEREIPIASIYPLASERSVGKEVTYGGKTLPVQDLAAFDFHKADYALFSAGGSVSAEYAPQAVASGCTVIDNTSEFRYRDEIPLVIPEVNGHKLQDFAAPGVIANPNCSTMQMLVALAPIHREFGISRINVATYQSVSGGGRKVMEELARQTADKLSFRESKPQALKQPIAFNVLPQIDKLQDNGYSREEMKMHWETQKILADDTIQVNATAVRVPVFYGHAEAVHLETRSEASVETVLELLRQTPGVRLIAPAQADAHPTPVTHAAGRDEVFVGRVRRDFSHPNGINLWIVSDNIRKGAALNAVQILETLAGQADCAPVEVNSQHG